MAKKPADKKKTAAPGLDIAALAASHTGPARKMVKVGSAPVEYTFEAEAAVDGVISSHENTFAPNNGALQLTVYPSVDGKAGQRVWINFPPTEDEVAEKGLTDKDVKNADSRWMEFLRAVFPELSIYAKLEVSDDGKEFTYYNEDGSVIDYETRAERADQANKASHVIAQQLRAGTFDLKGRALCFWPKLNNNGKLFFRFRAAGFQPDLEG